MPLAKWQVGWAIFVKAWLQLYNNGTKVTFYKGGPSLLVPALILKVSILLACTTMTHMKELIKSFRILRCIL